MPTPNASGRPLSFPVGWRVTIRGGLFGLAVVLAGSVARPYIMAASPSERPEVVVVRLSRGSTATFTLKDDRLQQIVMTVGDTRVEVPLKDCRLPPTLHLDSFVLNRDDLRTDEHRSNGYTLLFDLGTEEYRKFGRLPRVQLSFEGGKLVASYLTIRTGGVQGDFAYPLCEAPLN